MEVHSFVRLLADISPDQDKVEHSGHHSQTEETAQTRPGEKSLRRETTLVGVPVTRFSGRFSPSAREGGHGRTLHTFYNSHHRCGDRGFPPWE